MAIRPRHGEVWLADLGIAGKVRPVVVLLADDLRVERSLIVHVPITSQHRGTELEIALGHLPFLQPGSYANVQAIGALPVVRFERTLGALPAAELAAIKRDLCRALAITP